MIMKHDHPLEWIWFVMTILDAWASSSSWLAAHRDWVRAKIEKESLSRESLIKRVSRDAVTYAIEVSALMNATMAFLLLSASTASLFWAPPPPSYKEVPQSLFLISVLIGVSGINATLAVHGRLVRYRLSVGYYNRQASMVKKAPGQVIADAYKPKEGKS